MKSEEDNLFGIKYSYQLYLLDKRKRDALMKRADAQSLCLLGYWYWYLAPTEDYLTKAENYFRQAIKKGSSEAKLHLANMYRLGELGKVDMDKYLQLRNEAISDGCQYAKIRYCKDIAYGVWHTANLDAAIAMALKEIDAAESPDPLWYDTLGWFFYEKKQYDNSEKAFLKAIALGYADSYSGLVDTPGSVKNGYEAGVGYCCIIKAEENVERYDKYYELELEEKEKGLNTAESKECIKNLRYLQRQEGRKIRELYKEACKKGDSAGYYYLGYVYYEGRYSTVENNAKAWECFMQGNRMGNSLCMVMLADMIEEGRASAEFHYEDACLFRLRALRYGDDSQLLPVVHCFHEGELEDYADEINRDYIPKYESLGDELYTPDGDGLENWPDDYQDDPEDDDGRFDPWA